MSDTNRSNSSLLAALAAGIVSVCALSVSIYEAYLMREQQAASVLPIIDFWAAFDGESAYSLNLANKGLGPAFIRDISVTVDDSPKSSWADVTRSVAQISSNQSESALIGSVMAPGEVGQMYAAIGADAAKEVWKQAGRISLDVCYCSVFDDCWKMQVSDLNTGTPTTEKQTMCGTGAGKSF